MVSQNWLFAQVITDIPGISNTEYVIRSPQSLDFIGRLFAAMRAEHDLVLDHYGEYFELADFDLSDSEPLSEEVSGETTASEPDESECQVAWRGIDASMAKLEKLAESGRVDVESLKKVADSYNAYHETGLSSAESGARAFVFVGDSNSFGRYFFQYLRSRFGSGNERSNLSPLRHFARSLDSMATMSESIQGQLSDVEFGMLLSWLDLYDELVGPW